MSDSVRAEQVALVRIPVRPLVKMGKYLFYVILRLTTEGVPASRGPGKSVKEAHRENVILPILLARSQNAFLNVQHLPEMINNLSTLYLFRVTSELAPPPLCKLPIGNEDHSRRW
jgi:hypothetical protein